MLQLDSMLQGHKHVTIHFKPMARSHGLQCQQGHKHITINAKPMGTISWASMSTRTQARNYQCQTNGHDLMGLLKVRFF